MADEVCMPYLIPNYHNEFNFTYYQILFITYIHILIFFS